MAISIDWGNKIINVPRNDMVLVQSVPTEIRKLDLNAFRLELKDLEDSSNGMAFERTNKHNTTVEVGGVILARVVEMINNYTITFENGMYAVNLVGANSNVGDVVNVNNVSVRSANSAGLQDLSTLLAAAYQGRVAVDVIKGQAGTSVPIGTRSAPVDNFDDAITIADTQGIASFDILTSVVLDHSDFSKGYSFFGDNLTTLTIGLDAGANVSNCQFNALQISGTLDGGNTIHACIIGDLAYTSGFVEGSAIGGTVTVAPNAKASFFNCYSNVAGGSGTAVINMGGTGSMVCREFSGGLTIENYAGGGDISIDMSSGRVIIDSSVTGGDIYIRGVVSSVIDNSTGTAVVHNDALTVSNIATAIWNHTQ